MISQLQPTSDHFSSVMDHDYWEDSKEDMGTIYEGYALSNYPGVTNLLYIPSDFSNTRKALAEGLRNRDWEQIFDATARLFGIPANLLSGAGTVASYGRAFGFFAHIPLFLTPITVIAGVILCFIEGIVDVVSLRRQNKFAGEFNFKILSSMKNLVSDVDATKTTSAIKELTKSVNQNLRFLENVLGKHQAKIVKNLLNEINHEVASKPESLQEVLENYRPALEEISKHLLVETFDRIKENYLVLSPEEKAEIERTIKDKNPNLTQQTIETLYKEALQKALVIKKKNLARRVRPWMAEEMSETVRPLLRGIIGNESEAIKEGLRLIDTIHIQSKKKRLAHILGIVALLFAAASVATVSIAFAPYILAGLAMTFSLLRAGVFAGMLKSRGWTLEPKKLLPLSIRKRIFSSQESTPEIHHQYRKSLLPIDQRFLFEESLFMRKLNLEKQGFESQRNHPLKLPSDSIRWISA